VVRDRTETTGASTIRLRKASGNYGVKTVSCKSPKKVSVPDGLNHRAHKVIRRSETD